MKKTAVVLSVLIMGLFLFTSCKKEESSSGGSGGSSSATQGQYFMNAVADGNSFHATGTDYVPGVVMQLTDTSGAPSGSAGYTIRGIDDVTGNIIQIAIALSSPTETGTFTYSSGGYNLFSYSAGGTNVWMTVGGSPSEEGTVTISENNSNYVRGTFSFTAYNVSDSTIVQVTNGEFKAKKW